MTIWEFLTIASFPWTVAWAYRPEIDRAALRAFRKCQKRWKARKYKGKHRQVR